MRPLPPWMDGDDPHYDPNLIGAVSQAKVLAALVAAGKAVLIPCVNVRPHRLRAAHRDTGWRRRVTDYRGEVDFFGVYCPENEAVYLVPIAAVAARLTCALRLTAAKNNQRKRTRRAADYLVVPLQAARKEEEESSPVVDVLGP